MRAPWLGSLIATLVVLGAPQPGLAQWDWNKTRSRGLFGERQMGSTIQSQPSTRFSNSFWRGPSGEYLGRDDTRTGSLFRKPGPANVYAPIPSPEMSPAITSRGLGFRDPTFAPPEYPVEIESGAAPVASAAAPVEPQPVAQPAPEIWFRGKSPPGDPEMDPAERTRTTVAPGPGITLSGVAPTLSSPPMSTGLGQAGSIDLLLSQSLQSQIASMPRFRANEPIRVSVSGGIATLQGAVRTQHDRKVLAEFVRMEPGIWNVKNQLTIQQ